MSLYDKDDARFDEYTDRIRRMWTPAHEAALQQQIAASRAEQDNRRKA